MICRLAAARAGFALLAAVVLSAAEPAAVRVDFSRTLHRWDGFGVNYVEVPQTRDYRKSPQEYGGLSALSEEKRQQIMELIFGADGLRPGLMKLFLDVWHQPAPGAAFDHEWSTKWMRYFAAEGLKRTKRNGDSMQAITTLYGPPAWATRQKIVRGRDLDPAQAENVGRYFIDWVQYLKKQQLPVKYVSLHNEGEDFVRWPVDGKSGGFATHDYNLYWAPKQVADFMTMLRPMMDSAGLQDVGIAPGETTNWWRFLTWGYAPTLWGDDAAMKAMGLITSHGFTGGRDQWYATAEPGGVELLRQKRPDLHAWTTSMTWGKMDPAFVEDIRAQIYTVRVNGVIPWAAVQTSKWVGGDPNPGTAIRVIEDCGCYQVMPGYFYYKQVTRAGMPGMNVAYAEGAGGITAMAFASGETSYRNAFVVINRGQEPRALKVSVAGSKAMRFEARRTSMEDSWAPAGNFAIQGGTLNYEAPAVSVTTFWEESR